MKIFVDTAPFIYLIENHPEFGEKVKRYFLEEIQSGNQLTTSVVTLAEFGVKPEKENRQQVIVKFEELLAKLNIDIHYIDREVAINSYKLRSKYKFLKGMDALQLGVALKEQCEKFITNDIPLKKIKEIQIVVISDLF